MEIALILISAAILVGGMIVLKFKTKLDVYKIIKTFAVVYFLICFIKMLFADGFIWVINGGFYGETLYERSDVLQSLLRWAMYFSSGVITCACFTKVKLFKNIATYFCLPLMLVSLFFFPDFIEYYMDGTGRGFKTSQGLRELILSLEFILGIAIPLLLRFVMGFKLDVKNKYDWLNLTLVTPILLLTMFPVYTIQSLFGYTSIIVGILKPVTIIWIIGTIGIVLLLNKVFKHKDYEVRYALCLWLCVILFMHYNSLYYMGISIKRLPIQLCNLGAYFFILSLIIKSRKFFDFTFVANIVGTIIAMIFPDIEGGIGYFWNVHFMLEHMLVLIVPSVIMCLGIFPRINKRSLKYIYIGFVIYFGFCLVSGMILNAFKDVIGEEVNYFYLFDAELIFNIIPSLKFILDINFSINGFVFYPIYILCVFVIYSILMYLFYVLVQALYKITDDKEEVYQNRQAFHDYLKQTRKFRTERKKKC